MINIEICILDKSTYDIVNSYVSQSSLSRFFKVHQKSIVNASYSTIVSAGNSFGEMNGGVDGIINTLLSSYTPHKYIQQDIKDILRKEHYGELHVGQSILIPTSHPKYTHLIYAPTMRVPEDVSKTINAYIAFRSVVITMMKNGLYSVSTPLFCTGAGNMCVEDCIHQMVFAVDSIVNDTLTSNICDWKTYHDHHRKIKRT